MSTLKNAMAAATIEVDRLTTITGLTVTSATVACKGGIILTGHHDGRPHVTKTLTALDYSRIELNYEKPDQSGTVWVSATPKGTKIILALHEEATSGIEEAA